MKYNELPVKWQKEAVEMALSLLNSNSREMAKEKGTEPYIYTEQDEELQDYISYTLYVILKDEVTGNEYLSEEGYV